MRRFLLFLWIASLVFAACLVSGSQSQTQSPKNEYTIALQGFVWDHSTLNALIVMANNESWWNPSYLSSATRAVGQWNDAITAFVSNYSNYSYLSNLRIQTTVSNVSLPGFDIYINWTDSSLSNMTDEIGLSQIFPDPQSVIINSTIILGTHANHGEPLNEVDMQHIALHELGHSLGLGHSNYTGDLMYGIYSLGSPPPLISTLDVYGVATLFAWETNSTNFYPINEWLNVNSVTLPLDTVDYRFLPVTSENATPQTLADNPTVQFLIIVFETLIHPEIAAVILVIIFLMLIVGLYSMKKRVKQNVMVDS